MNKKQLQFVELAQEEFGVEAVLTRADVTKIVDENNLVHPYWFTKDEYRAGRGTYKLPNIGTKQKTMEKEPELEVALAAQVLQLKQPKLIEENDSAVPAKYPDYVPFGFFKDLHGIIKSASFYPVFITGLSGNGKTLMVEQVCAQLNRECVRVNISIETDDSDLLGGYQLINGNTVYKDGPVIQAMKRGAVLLIDEVDRGSNKLMCLQGILEGKPYLNKKTGEMVYPSEGFNIIATANTKGRGSDEGKYLSQILDDAFLERFPITVEQEYPDAKTERKILSPLIADKDFVEKLAKWADVVRQSFDQGATDEIISTRRLVHIAKAYKIFGDKLKAIQLCVARFDTETRDAFIDLYTKVDSDVENPANNTTQSAQAGFEGPNLD